MAMKEVEILYVGFCHQRPGPYVYVGVNDGTPILHAPGHYYNFDGELIGPFNTYQEALFQLNLRKKTKNVD